MLATLNRPAGPEVVITTIKARLREAISLALLDYDSELLLDSLFAQGVRISFVVFPRLKKAKYADHFT